MYLMQMKGLSDLISCTQSWTVPPLLFSTVRNSFFLLKPLSIKLNDVVPEWFTMVPSLHLYVCCYPLLIFHEATSLLKHPHCAFLPPARV